MSRDLERVRMWDKSFPAILLPAELNGSFFDSGTKLENISFGDKKHGFVSLADLHWSDANLLTVNWAVVTMLGDEHRAHRTKDIKDYRAAVRANRQVAVGLQNQGLNEEAAYFAYRAQKLQRTVLRLQRRFGQYLFSLLLDLLAGYGYKLWRSFAAYLIVIGVFAAIYYHLGSHLAWNEAIVISMTAFHGRGFFPDQFHPRDPQALVAAIEAFVGLLIEVTFIATLTQRLFGK